MSKCRLVTPEEAMRIVEMWNEGATLRYISFVFKRDLSTIRRYTSRKQIHKRWTESDVQKAVRLLSEGKNYRQIGNEIGRTRNAVKQYFVDHREQING